jgi:Ca-activated chloride channel family protein
MRSLVRALAALVVALFVSSPALAQTTTAGTAWIGGAPLRTRLVVDGSGETWVGVWVDAPTTVTAAVRAPMAVSLVVDTSGSMAGDKIANAQLAASSLLESLADGDIVSIYGFASGVTEIAPPTVLDPTSRSWMMRRVSMLVAGGGTDIESGLRVGIARLAQAPSTHPTRRMFLISDGRATLGQTNPTMLGDLAAGATEWGAQVTAIGVGYDYDPMTLNGIVVRTAGRLHHLGQPQQMASILESEMSWLSRSVALNAAIEVRPAPGVTILSGATTGAVVADGALRLPLGVLVAGQRRELLFRVRLAPGITGSRPLATASLVFESPADRVVTTQSYSLTMEVSRSGSASAETPRVAAMVAQYDASEAERRAAELMAQGERDRAVRELETARTVLATTATSYDFEDAEVAGALARRRAEVDSAATAARSASTPSEMRARSYEMQAAPMAADGY